MYGSTIVRLLNTHVPRRLVIIVVPNRVQR